MAGNAVSVLPPCRSYRRGAAWALDLVALLALLLWGGAARAQANQRMGADSLDVLRRPPPKLQPGLPGKNCLGEPERKLILDHSLVGSINPLGLENRMRLSVCAPLIRRPGLLFAFSNIEAGGVNYVSPTHIHLGGFVNLAPISVLVLRAEVTGFFIWPLSLQGAGYIPLPSYEFTRDALSPPPSKPQAGRAYGVRTLLGATLQGQLPLGKRASLALVNAFTAEFWRVNGLDIPTGQDLPFYYLARNDVTMRAAGDWVLSNTAVALVGIEVGSNYTVRLGVTDDLTLVPANGKYTSNMVSGLFAFMVKDVGGVAKNLQIFLRAGTFTDHAFREGFAMAGGLNALYDLTPGRWRSQER